MILSLDIGGSKIAAGLVKNNKVFYFQKTDWQKPLTAKKIIDQIIQIILDFRLKISDFTVIAVGIAGQVNKKGEVFLTRNLIRKKTKVSLKKILEQKFQLPVFVENDANCFTLGEAIFGQGKGKNLVIGLTLGSGIGGGIVLNQKIIRGKDGYAGELGHMAIQAGGKKCSCGKRGCFEAYASVTALRKIYSELTGKKTEGTIIDEAVKKKDKKALLAAQGIAENLAVGLGNLIDIFNPDIIVLGGGLSNSKTIMKLALEKIKNWTLMPNNKTQVVVSKLEDKAALLGAFLLVKK